MLKALQLLAGALLLACAVGQLGGGIGWWERPEISWHTGALLFGFMSLTAFKMATDL